MVWETLFKENNFLDKTFSSLTTPWISGKYLIQQKYFPRKRRKITFLFIDRANFLYYSSITSYHFNQHSQNALTLVYPVSKYTPPSLSYTLYDCPLLVLVWFVSSIITCHQLLFFFYKLQISSLRSRVTFTRWKPSVQPDYPYTKWVFPFGLKFLSLWMKKKMSQPSYLINFEIKLIYRDW